MTRANRSQVNYSILLPRSVDWDLYRSFLAPASPDDLDRSLGIVVFQMLWDRCEVNGYVNHLTVVRDSATSAARRFVYRSSDTKYSLEEALPL